jgi:hypothetical protein
MTPARWAHRRQQQLHGLVRLEQRRALHAGAQRFTAQQLHDHEHRAIELAHVVDIDHIRVIDAACGASFAKKAPHQLRMMRPARHPFDRERLVGDDVRSLKHDAHAAAAQVRVDAVLTGDHIPDRRQSRSAARCRRQLQRIALQMRRRRTADGQRDRRHVRSRVFRFVVSAVPTGAPIHAANAFREREP